MSENNRQGIIILMLNKLIKNLLKKRTRILETFKNILIGRKKLSGKKKVIIEKFIKMLMYIIDFLITFYKKAQETKNTSNKRS